MYFRRILNIFREFMKTVQRICKHFMITSNILNYWRIFKSALNCWAWHEKKNKDILFTTSAKIFAHQQMQQNWNHMEPQGTVSHPWTMTITHFRSAVVADRRLTGHSMSELQHSITPFRRRRTVWKVVILFSRKLYNPSYQVCANFCLSDEPTNLVPPTNQPTNCVKHKTETFPTSPMRWNGVSPTWLSGGDKAWENPHSRWWIY